MCYLEFTFYLGLEPGAWSESGVNEHTILLAKLLASTTNIEYRLIERTVESRETSERTGERLSGL